MNYRSILVCVEREETVDVLCAMASRIGFDPKTHITVAHSLLGAHRYLSGSPHIPKSVIEEIEKQNEVQAGVVKSKVEKAMKSVQCQWEWRQLGGRHTCGYQSYAEMALTTDMVITSQSGSEFEGSSLQREILLQAGTPVLMVPSDWRSISDVKSFNKVSVAWNATVESARAVRESMPLLIASTSVQVVCVGQKRAGASGGELPGVDLANYLGHHDISATVHELNGKNLNVGVNLLDHARENHSDLLAMGGFGHSRLYDVVLGAATGEVMKNMHIPVLMAH